MNSRYDSNLAKSIAIYEREYIFTIASLEYERQDLKQFLKGIYRCESDKDPAAVK